MKKIGISIGDLNGIGIEITLKSHKLVKEICEPLYFINSKMLKKASILLDCKIPKDFNIVEISGDFKIEPSKVSMESGKFSFESFIGAVEFAKDKKVDGIVTLPINKEAWKLAGVPYRGHTEALREIFQKDAIMMMGCDKLFVGLFSEHIPLKDVVSKIKLEKLESFLLDFYKETKVSKIGVLGLNPHAGDNRTIGDEEKIIEQAIRNSNKILDKEIFRGCLVPDIAFTPKMREKFKYFVAIYHDQGLAPLKALYFEESINVSLNLPIKRASVGHGTAFDIAYKNMNPSNLSYLNGVKFLVDIL